jgi:hypothetical protein
MPCNSRITVTVEMGKHTDSGLLLDGLKTLGVAARDTNGDVLFKLKANGLSGIFRSTTKRLEIPGQRGTSYEESINAIKAAYSYQVVMSSLRKIGASAMPSVGELGTVVNVKLQGGR